MKLNRALFAALAAASFACAAPALAASAPSSGGASLASQYSGWAGGKANADALVAGLRGGTAITLATTGPERSVSLAGFTPAGQMSDAQIASALASARRSLARLGITQPTAEQIQAALIGGDVVTPGGATVMMNGPVAAVGGPPATVAVR